MLALSTLLVAALPMVVPPPVPLTAAHAHNDYEHSRPLHDALACGFCSVEADIWLRDGKLLVAHTPFGLKADRTLQKLYLDPLRERTKRNGGKVFADGPVFHLMIDVKTEAKETWPALAKVLDEYADLLTVTNDGKTETKAVTVVISGSADREGIEKANPRRAAIDGRPKDLETNPSSALVPWVSDAWKNHFKWDGTGDMPDAERKKLTEYMTKAHTQGRKVRFWATPDKPEVWRELHAAGCDFINTDKLDELQAFLLKARK
jgi:glycerophosphoryl diester phosphodiesterase